MFRRHFPRFFFRFKLTPSALISFKAQMIKKVDYFKTRIYCQDVPTLPEGIISTIFHAYFVGLEKKIVGNLKGMFPRFFPQYLTYVLHYLNYDLYYISKYKSVLWIYAVSLFKYIFLSEY